MRESGTGINLTMTKGNITPGSYSTHLQSQQYYEPTRGVSGAMGLQAVLGMESTQGVLGMVNDEIAYGELEGNESNSFPDPYVAYKIMPAEEDRMALDVTTQDNPDKGLVKNNIIIWDYHGGPNQHFYFKKIANQPQCYYIINSSTGFTLEVPHQTRESTQVHVNPRNNTPGERWELIECGKRLYKFKSFCGMALDVAKSSLKNGASVIQFQDNDGKNQKWKLVPA